MLLTPNKPLLKRVKESDFLRKRQYEAVIFLALFFSFFGFLGSQMGISNMLNTMMQTAWDLLMNTVFYIMGITVLTGALGRLMVEFGVMRLLEAALAPLVRPVFNLPGVAALAGLMTFFSDNPAIISLANDKSFNRFFKKHELLSLTNFGTAFGMGLIVLTYMSSFGFFSAAMVGFLGAIIGAAVSTRLMQYYIRDLVFDDEEMPDPSNSEELSYKSEGSAFLRFLNSILDGGKSGVSLGVAIIPGVLIISTFIMMLTFGPKDTALGYQGIAYEGVPVLPYLADKVDWLFSLLFGFESPELIAFPITALGAVGAALSLVKTFIEQGLVDGNVIAVFTAMGMAWSGYLSTHTAMLDTLGHRELTPKALSSHTIGGIVAGVSAHYLFVLSDMLGWI